MPVKQVKRRGRPRKYVLDSTGQPVPNLSLDRTTGQHFTKNSDGRKVYFGADRDDAIRRLRAWEAQQQGRKVALADTRPMLAGDNWYDLRHFLPDPPIVNEAVAVEVDEDAFWAEVRRRLFADPTEFARRVGEPRIARLEDLDPIEPSLTLAEVWELFTSRRKQCSPHWRRQQEWFWRQFVKIVGKPTLADITQDDIRRYQDKITELGKGKSATWRNHRLGFIGACLRAVMKQRRDVARIQKVLAFCGIFEFDAKARVDPKPIGRDKLARILAVAPTKWKAGILLALNLALYPSELAAVRKDELDLDAGTFASRRRKTGIVRVGVLWQRTIDAVRAYLAVEPHPHAETLFVNKLGLPYNGQHVSRNWRKIVERAGLTGVEFAQLRDGAYTAAVEAGASFDACKLLAGHATGIPDAYAARRPDMVAKACRAIEQAYFDCGAQSHPAPTGQIA